MKYLLCLATIALLLPLVGCTSEPTPADAMQTMTTGLSNNQPQVAWEGLPPSYQQDVDGLVQDFASKLDPEIYDTGFKVAQKAVRVLDEKRDFILQNEMLPDAGVDVKAAEEHWDGMVKALGALVHSEISTLDQLKKLNIQEFLSGSGAEFMEQLDALAAISQQETFQNDMADYKQAKFTLVEATETTALVNVEVPSKSVEPVEMVKIEGKWIPKDLADDWDRRINEARETLANISPQEMAENKDKVMATLKMIDSQLNLLLSAKTVEQFNGTVGGIALMLSMGGGGGSFFDSDDAPTHEEMPIQIEGGGRRKFSSGNESDDLFDSEPAPDSELKPDLSIPSESEPSIP